MDNTEWLASLEDFATVYGVSIDGFQDWYAIVFGCRYRLTKDDLNKPCDHEDCKVSIYDPDHERMMKAMAS